MSNDPFLDNLRRQQSITPTKIKEGTIIEKESCRYCYRKYVDIESHEEKCSKNPANDKPSVDLRGGITETELWDTTKIFMAYYKQQEGKSINNQRTCVILYGKFTQHSLIEEMDKIKELKEKNV